MATWLFSDARTGDVCKTTNFSDRHVLQQLGNMEDEDKPVVVVKKVVLSPQLSCVLPPCHPKCGCGMCPARKVARP